MRPLDTGDDEDVTDSSLGVLDMAIALRSQQRRFELDTIAGTRRLPDGHSMTMRWSGDVLELERDDGEIVLLSTETLL